MTRCLWCQGELRFDPVKGWVHADDGELYKRRPDGTDDHCALPDRRGRSQSMAYGTGEVTKISEIWPEPQTPEEMEEVKKFLEDLLDKNLQQNRQKRE